MIFWHIATIFLALPGEEDQIIIRLPFPDEMSCGEALPHLFEAVRAEYPESIVTCRATDLPSGVTTRPQARPN